MTQAATNLRIALVGNPNSGKTTLFNALTGTHQFVGNWPGVTVEKKEGRLKGHQDHGGSGGSGAGNVTITDLPGIYSLSPYSPEEIVARDYLLNERPDVILNIVDGTNLERNLYLTTQLTELDIPVVVALNRMDVVERDGIVIDTALLAAELGCPVIEISALKQTGLDALTATLLETACVPHTPKPLQLHAPTGTAEDIAAARYAYIDALVDRCVAPAPTDRPSISERIDAIVTNRWLAFPIFAAVIFFIYFISITTVGALLQEWVADGLFGDEWGIPALAAHLLAALGVTTWLESLVVDGIIAGVGAVLEFVPQIFMLFVFLAFLESCGYMARVAFIMDRLFRRFGLSGKSCIPIMIGTGCSVPALMASRTIENESNRRMTVMTTSFMPCSAKLPVIALISGALFGGAWWVAPSAYFVGIAAIICSGIILKKTRLFSGDTTPFIMELPDYHLPTAKAILRSTWERGWSFVKRAGTIILLAAVAIWFGANFGFTEDGFGMVAMSESLLAMLGNALAWIFAPLGWGDWRATVATLTGLVAKENIVSTFGILFNFSEVAEDGVEVWGYVAANFTALSAYSFLVFNLLCAPCFAAIATIRREMSNAKWFWFTIGYQGAFAYAMALCVYQLGTLVSTGRFTLGTVAALALVAGFLYLLTRGTEELTGEHPQHHQHGSDELMRHDRAGDQPADSTTECRFQYENQCHACRHHNLMCPGLYSKGKRTAEDTGDDDGEPDER